MAYGSRNRELFIETDERLITSTMNTKRSNTTEFDEDSVSVRSAAKADETQEGEGAM